MLCREGSELGLQIQSVNNSASHNQTTPISKQMKETHKEILSGVNKKAPPPHISPPKVTTSPPPPVSLQPSPNPCTYQRAPKKSGYPLAPSQTPQSSRYSPRCGQRLSAFQTPSWRHAPTSSNAQWQPSPPRNKRPPSTRASAIVSWHVSRRINE